MRDVDWAPALDEAAGQARAWLAGLAERPVGARATTAELRRALGAALPEGPTEARQVIAELAAAAGSGLAAGPGGRYFGFVTGGSTPAALAADWLTSAWDQNAFAYESSPAAAVAEEVAASWVTELLGLPPQTSVGFVTGAQMANVTALLAARHHVLARVGWDVERDGLVGAPPIRVLVGAERHATVDRALRFIGLGDRTAVVVAADDQGRMRPDALAAALADSPAGAISRSPARPASPGPGDAASRMAARRSPAGRSPAIVCVQAGNVNSGAVDPLGELCSVAQEAGAWVHVDGAFGLWAAASPHLAHHFAGVERADSWATDAHKWLNVPYDSGLACCAHPDAHRAATALQASYLPGADIERRDGASYAPEASRRARGFAVYAAICALGRTGVADLVERTCRLAQRFATRLGNSQDVDVLNEVALNQVLVRFRSPGGDHDAHTRRVIERAQREGTCWMSGTTWHGMAAMRISVSNWTTDEADVDRSVAAILRCARQPDPR